VPAGGSIDFRVRPGKYKARWDSCRAGRDKAFFAATLWRESAVTVARETQLYAYVGGGGPPTRFAKAMGRDFAVVRFPGQAVDLSPQAQRPQAQQVALRASADETPRIAGFIGRVVLSAELVAARDAASEPTDTFNAREFVDGSVRIAPPKPGQAPKGPRPSLDRKHELSTSTIEYKKH
jgi:hypothetical protein